MLFLHYKGYLIEHVHIQVLEYVMFGNIAELGDFRLYAVVQGEFGTADKDIGLNAHSLKVFYAGLSRLGLKLL